jgi:hypothetical protein
MVPRTVPVTTRTTLATLGGPWRVRFATALGAPAEIAMPTLKSFTTSSDSGVKYFSGTASYTRSLQVPATWFARDRRVVLSLGDVRDIAEVVVNGTALPQAWKAPFEVDVTRALRPGTNTLEIRVTNQWTNRIIGDRALPPEKKVLSSAPQFFGGPPPLQLAGLLGPVTLVAIDTR